MAGSEPLRGRLDLRGARWAALGWGIFLLTLTSWPSPPDVPVVSRIPNFDKLVHTILYGVEAFLLCRAIAWPPASRSAWLRALAVAGVIAVWATLDELHQFWIPGRSMEGLDAVADITGGFTGALTSAWLALRSSRPVSP
ncbi:MAG TPA: VanZ family protein [Thermoanaerobaculia bacterium]